MIDFSFLVPTRNRPDMLRRFLNSLLQTTSDPSKLEILLGIDEDDTLSPTVDVPGLQIRRVFIPPGQRMGRLNNALAEQALGRYLMVQNDDIIARTPGWDDLIRGHVQAFDDGIFLIHTNDLLFKERLCCFPLVSRTYTDLVGLCSDDFKRYRIDDNIFDIFMMLSMMGERRVVYLPEVVFEHDNFEEHDGQRLYFVNNEAFRHDVTLYNTRFDQRRQDAMTLFQHIQTHRQRKALARGEERLRQILDPYSVRRTENIDIKTGGGEAPTVQPNAVTIGLVTSDATGLRTRLVLDALKSAPAGFQTLVVSGAHPHRLGLAGYFNQLVRAATTPYVLLLTDEVLLQPGWLEGLLKEMRPGVGVVAPVHTSQSGEVLSAGMMLTLDGRSCGAVLTPPAEVAPVAAVDCNVALVRRSLALELGFSEAYKRLFFDVDFGLRCWESHAAVLVTPQVVAQRMEASPPVNAQLHELLVQHDGALLVGSWGDGVRLTELWRSTWTRYPALQQLYSAVFDWEALLGDHLHAPLDDLAAFLEDCLERAWAVPLFRDLLRERMAAFMRAQARLLEPSRRNLLMRVVGSFGSVELVEPGVMGYNVFQLDGRYLAFPADAGMPEREVVLKAGQEGLIWDFRLKTLLARLEAGQG